MKLKIVKKIAKEHPFNSRNWNYQKIIRYLLSDENNRIIEAMVIWHIKDGTVVEFLCEKDELHPAGGRCKGCRNDRLLNVCGISTPYGPCAV